MPQVQTQPKKINFVIPRDWEPQIRELMKKKRCVTVSELMRKLLAEAIEKEVEQ